MNQQNQQTQSNHKNPKDNPKVNVAQTRFNLVYPMVEEKQNTQLIYEAFQDNAKWKYNFTDQQKLDYFNKEKKIIVWACIFQTDKDYHQFDDFLMAFYTWLEEKAEFPIEVKKGQAKKYVQKQPVENQIEQREHFQREREREKERQRQREREREREQDERQKQRKQKYEREQKQLREKTDKAQKQKQLQREKQRYQENQKRIQEQQQLQRQIRYQQNQSNRNPLPSNQPRSNPRYQQTKQNIQQNRQVIQKQQYINRDDFVKKILTKIADIIDLPERKCKSRVQIFANIQELRRIEAMQKAHKK